MQSAPTSRILFNAVILNTARRYGSYGHSLRTKHKTNGNVNTYEAESPPIRRTLGDVALWHVLPVSSTDPSTPDVGHVGQSVKTYHESTQLGRHDATITSNASPCHPNVPCSLAPNAFTLRSVILLQHLRNSVPQYPYVHSLSIAQLRGLDFDAPFLHPRSSECWDANISRLLRHLQQLDPEELVVTIELLSKATWTKWPNVFKTLGHLEKRAQTLTNSQVLRVIFSLGTICRNLGLSSLLSSTQPFLGKEDPVIATEEVTLFPDTTCARSEETFDLRYSQKTQEKCLSETIATADGIDKSPYTLLAYLKHSVDAQWQYAVTHLIERLFFSRLPFWDNNQFFDPDSQLTEDKVACILNSLEAMKILTPDKFLVLLRRLLLHPYQSSLAVSFITAHHLGSASHSTSLKAMNQNYYSHKKALSTTFTLASLWTLWVSSVSNTLRYKWLRTRYRNHYSTLFTTATLFASLVGQSMLQNKQVSRELLTGDCVAYLLSYASKMTQVVDDVNSDPDAEAVPLSFVSQTRKLRSLLLDMAPSSVYQCSSSSLVTLLVTASLDLLEPDCQSRTLHRLRRWTLLTNTLQLLIRDSVLLSSHECRQVLSALSVIRNAAGRQSLPRPLLQFLTTLQHDIQRRPTSKSTRNSAAIESRKAMQLSSQDSLTNNLTM